MIFQPLCCAKTQRPQNNYRKLTGTNCIQSSISSVVSSSVGTKKINVPHFEVKKYDLNLSRLQLASLKMKKKKRERENQLGDQTIIPKTFKASLLVK